MKSLVFWIGSLPALAAAHPGHGIEAASHWHASDTWGYAVLAVLVIAALWLSKGK